ncbi:MAG: DUF86 domain-containing protein [Caldilineaceae bacterium]|nr:DUF86 domain-containing protein [Caldilineaceae bacterium]
MKSLDIDSFLEDQKTQSAVMHQIMIIGEAGKRLSMEFRSENSEIPWRQITGMRDFLTHSYDYVDIERVWGTLQPISLNFCAVLNRFFPPNQPSDALICYNLPAVCRQFSSAAAPTVCADPSSPG